MTPDRADLQSWYRQAMAGRIDELRARREGIAAGDPAACDAARAVGQALRGSGATFGFPDVSDVAALVEGAPDASLLRRVEGLIAHLSAFREPAGSERPYHAEWLTLAAGGVDTDERKGFTDLRSAWGEVGASAGLDPGRLAARVAERLGLATAHLAEPSRAALRLVPEALMRRGLVLPVAEDAETITVATGNPTSLTMEIELLRLTGRSPVFAVAPPSEIERAHSAVLDVQAGVRTPPRRAVIGSDDGVGRVLIVDDDASSRLLARTILERHGYEVVEAGDGLEALERLGSSQPVALVVADLNMPRMDGLELIWEMRGNDQWMHIPVIVVTGETDEVLETKLIEEGADDYIRKPMDPRLFSARVGATIRRADD